MSENKKKSPFSPLINEPSYLSSEEGDSKLSNHIKNKANQNSFHKIDFDEALKSVGSGNWYQIRACIYFSGQWFFAAWILLGSSFILFPSEFDQNFCAGLSDDDCKTLVCKQPNPKQYMTNSETSMIGTFNLICDDYKVQIIQSVPYIGSLLGFFLFSWIADNYGRKIALALLLALSWDYYAATFGFFLAGFGVNPAVTVQLSLLSEHSLGKFREYTTIGCQVFYGIGECAMVGIAYLVPNWRYMTLFFLAIPMLAMNFAIFLIYESPKQQALSKNLSNYIVVLRYVYEKSTLDAFEILNKIAVVNKKEKLKINTLMSVLKDKQDEKYSVIHLFKYPSLRVRTIFASLIFFSIQGVYYGVTFAMSKIGLNLYANTIIISTAETLAYAVTDNFIPKIKRKKITFIGMTLCCILCFCYLILDPPSDCDLCSIAIFQIVFAAIIRFAICFVWTVMYMYITELFPTVVKSLALGVVSAGGTAGSASAPYVGALSTSIGVNPMIALGVMGIIGVVSVIPLKETFGLPLKNKIEEQSQEEDQLIVDD